MGSISSEIIQIISTIIGLVISIVAVIISVLSLKQTQRSIEDANRPYVVVYRDYVQVLDTVHEYIIIKNFGKSGAVIDSLEFDPNYTEQLRGTNIFENISNTFIAPGQSISTIVSANAFQGERQGVVKATIDYHFGKKSYKETFFLNEELIHDLAFAKSKPSKSKRLEEVITKASEEMLRKNL